MKKTARDEAIGDKAIRRIAGHILQKRVDYLESLVCRIATEDKQWQKKLDDLSEMHRSQLSKQREQFKKSLEKKIESSEKFININKLLDADRGKLVNIANKMRTKGYEVNSEDGHLLVQVLEDSLLPAGTEPHADDIPKKIASLRSLAKESNDNYLELKRNIEPIRQCLQKKGYTAMLSVNEIVEIMDRSIPKNKDPDLSVGSRETA